MSFEDAMGELEALQSELRREELSLIEAETRQAFLKRRKAELDTEAAQVRQERAKTSAELAAATEKIAVVELATKNFWETAKSVFLAAA